MPPAWLLTTPRLGLRTWRDDDIDLALLLWGDPEVSRFIHAGGPPSRESVEKRLANEMETQRAHGIQYWPMFLLEGGDFVGCCGLRPYRLDDKVHELGVHLLPAFWRRGIAHEAATAVIHHAFEQLGVSALFAGHNPDNDASRQMLSKLGFRYTHDELYPPTGRQHPSYLLRPDR